MTQYTQKGIIAVMDATLRPVYWVASSKDDLRAFPSDVQDLMGYALEQAQRGAKHRRAKPLRGFGGAGVLEIVDDFDGDTYRAVYTVRLRSGVYVLHCWQKKSRHGIETSAHDIALIRARLRAAETEDVERART